MEDTGIEVWQMFEFSALDKEKVLSGYFTSLDPLKLREFPAKQKRKYIVLSIIADTIPEKTFSEMELNFILSEIHDDFVTIRRALIDYRFMERTRDGKSYWKAQKKT